jgi:BsuBI/PstI restriction endonuclease domain/BsuBI/PstI restriction endonuclease HTH domain
MPKKSVERMVQEALEILEALGIPTSNMTARRKQKMAKAFLAVAGLKPNTSWDKAQDNDLGYRLRSREIIAFMNAHLGEAIADSSYDDIRREDLVLPVEALIVLKSAANLSAMTNDHTRGYAIEPQAAKAIRQFGTPQWGAAVKLFLKGKSTLRDQLQRTRQLARIPVNVGGKALSFSPGAHNQLQKQIIEQFLPIYGFAAEVLYVGDTTKKNLFLQEERLQALHFFELAHDKLPDVVAYSATKNWLYLIEAVTTANPIDELRRRTLAALTARCTAGVVYVTAFPDRATYRKFAKDIAWETEVWIADAPEHMIHFNGDKFLGPYKA